MALQYAQLPEACLCVFSDFQARHTNLLFLLSLSDHEVVLSDKVVDPNSRISSLLSQNHVRKSFPHASSLVPCLSSIWG